MENSKFELTQNNELEEINQPKGTDFTSALKLERENDSDSEIQNELMIKSKELEVAFSQINALQLTIEEMKIKANPIASITDTLNEAPDTIQLEVGEKTKLVDEFKDNKSDATMCNHLETIYELNEVITKLKSELEEKLSNEKALNNEFQIVTVELDNEKLDIEKQLKNKLVTTTTGLQDALEELKEMKIKLELNDSEIEKLKTLLDLVKSELADKLTLIKMENSKFELTQNNELEEINQSKCTDFTSAMKLESENDSDSEIHNELMIKSKELEVAFSQINTLQLTIEEMKIKTNPNAYITDTLNEAPDTILLGVGEKTILEDEFKDNKSDATMCNHLETINELNEVIIKLKSELEVKLSNEKALNNEFQIVTVELDDAVGKVNDVKSVINILNIKHESLASIVEQLNYELICIKSTLNEKNELIFELENANLELSKECKNSDDQLNKIITDLKINLEDKIKVENEMQVELKAKAIALQNVVIQENKVQTMVESLENELKSKVILLDQFKSELATKSNLVSELENANSELTLKCDKINETMLNNLKNNDQYHTDIQNKLQLVIAEKTSDLNMTNQKLMELSKHHHELVNNLEDKVQQQVLNYHSLYTQFISLSCDIESLLNCSLKTESDFREEILLKSIELEHLQKEYDTLEEEYMLRTRECDEAREKILHFESISSRYSESERILKKEVESKCIALEEYKKNIEFLFSRNDSFQVRVNDFEDNVLVDLNEEFDLLKSEKANLECDLDKLREKLNNVIKEMELSEERCEDLASIINVLVIEIKDANSVKQNLESCLNEAEYELIKSGDYCKDLEFELYNVQRELENACINSECVEKELQNLKCKFNDNIDKKDLDGCDVRNKLIDPLVDYVHDIKLKLTELNSAIISGNQSEKLFRTKVMSMKDDILPVEETLKINCESERDSPDIGLEIDDLHKLLKENINLVNTLQASKNDMEKSMIELQCQIQKKSDENNKYINDITLMENDLKEKTILVRTLNDELNQVKLFNTELKEQINEPQLQIIKLLDANEKLKSNITLIENDLKEKTSLVRNLEHELNELQKQYTKLEEHNLANKEQVCHSYDIDSELRNGKRNIINEINLLEPGKITGVPTDHNLSNLLDMFVSLIMTKEHQIVTDLVNDHNKIKQLYEDQIKQFQEDIKKGKEWQEQVESDNEKLGIELENLKSQKHSFPGRELKIKELTEKVLAAENQSFNYLSELQELKTQLSKTSELNYQSLTHEFEVFKTSSELSIQDMNNKLENISKQYNETLSMYNDQKNNCFSLEDKIEKIQTESACLKSVIEKKDEDIKNLLEGFQLKTNEYETLIEKYSLQKEEMKIDHEKKINELQLDLSDTKHNMYCTEKVLKELNKNIEQLREENSLHVLTIKHMQENISDIQVAELESNGQITEFNKIQIENLEKELQVKSTEIRSLETELKVKSTEIRSLETELKAKCTVIESLETELKVKTIKLKETEVQCSKQVNLLEASYLKKKEFEKQIETCYQTLKIKDDQIENYQIKLKMDDIGLTEVNDITEKLRKILKCNGTLSTLYENICLLMTKCENLEEAIMELKQSNVDLDNECESMLEEVKNKDDKITELLTQVDELKENIVLLTEERDFLKNKCEQFKNFNDDVKKLNEEICGYEQNIYELRKDKGQLIVQHDKELKQLKNELNEVQSKNMELLNDYSKLSETAKNLEKSLKEDIQQLNRCIVDKNAKISTLELFSKTNNDDLKKKNHELENVFKRARDENHMLRRELRRMKEITNVCTADQYTQTVEEQSLVSSAIVADHKSMIDKIAKYEKDSKMMKMMLHHRKSKIEDLEKQLNERHS